jgi:hypothetical protein
MRKRFESVTGAGAAVAAAALHFVATVPAALQAQGGGQVPTPGEWPRFTVPRMADGRPNLNGIWQALVSANFNLEDHEAQAGPYTELMGTYSAEPAGQSVVEGGVIPYRPEALAKRKQNFENRAKADVSRDDTWHALGDPELKCYMPGVPRATYMGFPFQIVQGSYDFILMAYEFASATRIVRMNWKEESPGDFWMGWSRGRWEGDTLVVDVTGQRQETWFDRSGNYHSDALRVTERYTLVSPYHMMYEATIEDPKTYSRPWKISFPLYRRMEKNIQLLEFKCQPFVEELLYGQFRRK